MPRTQTVTIVFTDLVGSTMLADELGPDAYEAFRRRHFGLLRAAATANGGTVVKTTGDGLLIKFTSAVDAVTAAVAMQQAVHASRVGEGRTVSIRVGVAVGEATTDDDDVFGAPVTLAARLCDRATADQVLCTEIIHLFVGDDCNFEFQALGEVELKGIRRPVPIAEVTWNAPELAEGVVEGAWIVELRPPSAPAMRMLVERAMEIGRAAPDVSVEDESVSRRHVRLEPAAGGLLVTDLGSTNGTWRDGERLDAPTLADAGDVLSIGGTAIAVVGPAPTRQQHRTMVHAPAGRRTDHRSGE